MDRKAMVFIGMGVECVGVVFAGVWIGRWLDQTYGWGQLGVASGAILGFVGWFVHLLVIVKQFSAEDPSDSGDNQKQ